VVVEEQPEPAPSAAKSDGRHSVSKYGNWTDAALWTPETRKIRAASSTRAALVTHWGC
jgi:hypothetical protein